MQQKSFISSVVCKEKKAAVEIQICGTIFREASNFLNAVLKLGYEMVLAFVTSWNGTRWFVSLRI